MKNLIRMIALVLSLCCLAFSARAQAGETEDDLGEIGRASCRERV